LSPLVSIIIPTYNRACLIGETLDSIIAQTYANWECIVVDDDSSDNTDQLMAFYVEKEPRIQYHHRPKDRHKGANACRNYGFELSNGEFIHWFDSDDLMANNNIQVKLNHLNYNQECDFCICKIVKFEGNFRRGKFIYSDSDLKIVDGLYEDYITGKISILNVTPLWRRRVFDPNNLYDEKVFQFQDLDFYSRLIFKNNLVGIINKELIYVRRNNDSISTRNLGFFLNVESFLKVKSRILERSPSNSEIVKFNIRDILWAMRWNMALRAFKEAHQCLSLCLKFEKYLPLGLRIKLLRVRVFFTLFRVFQKGDTRFRRFLKI